MITNDIISIKSAIGQTEYWRNICQIMAGNTFRSSWGYCRLFACIRLLFYIRLWKCKSASFFLGLLCCPFDYSFRPTFSAIFYVKLPRHVSLKTALFWDVTPWSPVKIFRSLVVSCCFYHQGASKWRQGVYQKLPKPHEVTCQKIVAFVLLALPTSRVSISLNTSHYCY
jgi:hypothetical protein